jgi:hypothetical protein
VRRSFAEEPRRMNEPHVRIRCKSPEETARCQDILTRAGFAPELSLTWLVVRDAHPDAVNEALVKGGAIARVAARDQLGKLIGYLLDRQGRLSDRASNLKHLTVGVIEDAGLRERYRPKGPDALVAGALALYEQLMATQGGFVSWERFLELFCDVN